MSAELAQRVVMVNSVSGMNTSEFYHQMKFLVTNESWDRCKNLQIPEMTRILTVCLDNINAETYKSNERSEIHIFNTQHK